MILLTALKIIALLNFIFFFFCFIILAKQIKKKMKILILTGIRTRRAEVFRIFSILDNCNGGKMRKISEFKDEWKGDSVPDWEKMNTLRSLRRAHIILYNLMQRINNNYQIHLLASVSTFITKVLLNLYYIMYELVNSVETDRRKQHSKDPSLSMIWCSYYFCRFFLVVSFAHCTAVSSKEASNIISKIEYRDFEYFSQQQVTE